MKNLLKLIVFLIYTIIVFVINEYYLLLACACFNIILMLTFRVSFKKALNNIIFLSGFIAITVLANALLDSLNTAVIICVRLIIVCNATYIFKFVLSGEQLAESIKLICYPLKIFKVNPEDISVMVCICITFIPILSNELKQIRYALKSKGIKKQKYIFKPFLYNILKRTSEISNSLRAKGYTDA